MEKNIENSPEYYCHVCVPIIILYIGYSAISVSGYKLSKRNKTKFPICQFAFDKFLIIFVCFAIVFCESFSTKTLVLSLVMGLHLVVTKNLSTSKLDKTSVFLASLSNLSNIILMASGYVLAVSGANPFTQPRQSVL